MESNRAQLSLSWLVRLRWWILAAEVFALAVAGPLFAVDVPLANLLALLAFAAASNALLQRIRGATAARPLHGAAALVLDVVVLTLILRESGGAANPFSVIYLVYITLAALLLGRVPTWILTVLSIAAYGSLFWFAPADLHAAHDPHAFAGHLRAMWIAFSLTAALTALSVERLTAAVQARDRELEAVRDRADRSERLASLTTLAAGAAHELGTPLGTIAVAAGELERAVARLPAADQASLLEDVRLIVSQLARCRRILEQMSAAGGELAGETPLPLALADLVAEARSQLEPEEAARLRVDLGVADATLVPHRAFVRVLLCLLRNAFDAGDANSTVDLGVATGAGGGLEVIVRDRGHGMSAEVLARATEPFFTTKSGGKGMGMGLFLANALAEGFGGRLALSSSPGQGTVALLELPGRRREPSVGSGLA